MIRLMTSDVSTFSGFVANGHQALQHVSSSPSKIPYVGFSPIRLQTGIQPQPSPVTHGLSARPTYTRILQTYMRSKPFDSVGRHYLRNRAFAQAGLPTLKKNDPVQRPLAHRWVMLSTSSSLTMASSETLDPSHRFMYYTMGLCPTALYGLASRGSPICSACLFPPCRLPYPDGPDG